MVAITVIPLRDSPSGVTQVAFHPEKLFFISKKVNFPLLLLKNSFPAKSLAASVVRLTQKPHNKPLQIFQELLEKFAIYYNYPAHQLMS